MAGRIDFELNVDPANAQMGLSRTLRELKNLQGGVIGFASKISGALFGVSLAGGGVFAVISGLRELADFTSKTFSQTFWEDVYGINPAMIQRAEAAHAQLRTSVSKTIALRQQFDKEFRANLLAGASPENRARLLTIEDREAKRKLASAQGDADLARESLRTATGWDGSPLSPTQRIVLQKELAQAEEKLAEARLNALHVDKQLREAVDAQVEAGVKDTPVATATEVRAKLASARFNGATALEKMGGLLTRGATPLSALGNDYAKDTARWTRETAIGVRDLNNNLKNNASFTHQ